MNGRLRIVLTGSLAEYPEGGGHWSAFLQYLFGLRALGHDVLWLDVPTPTGDGATDAARLALLERRLGRYGLAGSFAAIAYRDEAELDPTLARAQVYGMGREQLLEYARSADLLWDFCAGLPQALLPLFRRRVLVDLDPGHFQLSAREWDVGIERHDAFLSVGTNLHENDCDVPTLGVDWTPFRPVVHLPMWPSAAAPGPDAAFTSVTQWTWEEIWTDGRVLNAGKRAAHMRYATLPRRAGRRFALAANIHESERDDRAEMRRGGWELVDPHRVTRSPSFYRGFVRSSRAEVCCCKPIYRELRTGWLSDRSACYLASGRPVLAEDTGFGGSLPVGEGLLAFTGLEEAVEGVRAIDRDYERHARAARALAEEFLDARKGLPAMIAACDRAASKR